MSTSVPFGIGDTLFKLRMLLQNTFYLSIIILHRALLVQFVPTDFFIFRFLLIRISDALKRLRPSSNLALDGIHIIHITKACSETFLRLLKDNFNLSLTQSWVSEQKLTFSIKSDITFSVGKYRSKLFAIKFANYKNLIYIYIHNNV